MEAGPFLWLSVQIYDKAVYMPTTWMCRAYIASAPRRVSIPLVSSLSFDPVSPVAVQGLRLAMVLPLLLGIALGLPVLSVTAVVAHDVFLAHLSGLVEQHRKTKKHQDDDPLVTFSSAFVGKVVNTAGWIAVLLTLSSAELPGGMAAKAVLAAVALGLVGYELVDMALRVIDFFPSRPSDEVGYARYGGAGGMIAFSIEAKIKEKLDSLGLAAMCVVAHGLAPGAAATALLVLVLAALVVSLRWAHDSVSHKLKVRSSSVGKDSALAELERLKLQSPVHQDPSIAGGEEAGRRGAAPEFTTAYTIGCFDLFHAGHIRLLERMREHAARVVVGVHDDESIFRLKNRYPMDNTVKRIRNVKTYADVVYVIPSTNPTPYLDCIIDRSDAPSSCYIRGADMPNFPGRELCEKLLSVVLLPYTEGVSSTKLRGELLERKTLDTVDREWIRYNGRWIRSTDEWLRYGDIWVRYPASLLSGRTAPGAAQ